ncbi:HNH endonuclease signature motif containing protein [Streptomyces polyrhachis]|uniref:HNH endonuclease signature motif containing protein n=1 Tax=Streptomyces polyrhachis TaxID=1282885 RepID=A0ABW2GFD9_9ACTN
MATRYTETRLREAAAACSSFSEAIVFCGGEPHERNRHYLVKRCRFYGIDVSHFSDLPRPYRRPRPSPEELRAAVIGSVSIAETLRKLDRRGNSGERAHLRGWLKEDGLDTSHFLGQAQGRGRPGTRPALTPEEILVRRDPAKGRRQTYLLRRALVEVGVSETCARCGCDPQWQGRAMTLEIDHINGDWSDNRAENLRFLCPNCHAITDTWCRGGSPGRK